MCGISGIVQKKNQTLDRSDIDKMVHAQRHRGPDGEGVYEGPGFFLGHNRLAILDLSDAGLQPMQYHHKNGVNYVLIHNGEVYNFIEIRDELRALGHQFKTETDTEVLVHAYAEWGVSCLDHFNGMFAFVVYDPAKKILFGARDRFGIKPLHLQMTAETFAFASEIKAFLAIGKVDGVDRQTVVDYLYAGHIHHSSRTFFKGVEELKPGHRFVYDLQAHVIKTEPWYVLRDHVRPLHIGAREAANKLRALLTESIRLRLRSDVRVGTCLSGGVDSSSIASIASTLYQGKQFAGITAESIDPETDESAFAQAVAEHAKLDWHRVKPQDFRGQLFDVLRAQDEPFAGLSVFMQDAVMRKARELGISVLLDGQGGDEVFLGYPKYLQARMFPPLRLFGKKLASAFGLMEAREFDEDFKRSAPRELEESREHLLNYRRALSSSAEAQILDITQTNLPQLLRYEDRNSMRYAVETRLPFLDYRIVEFGLGLKFGLKVAGHRQKAVLRDAMRGAVPTQVLERRDKIGFAAPDRSWQQDFQELWREHVIGSKLLTELLPDQVRRPANALSASSQWKLINLALWSQGIAKD
ncbi:asparagine synthase (glutamine-hydrolyzing) [soil metagenome]